jgi:sigma-B regulation protein RsbU (phosphoserine phosphatase)
LKRGDVFVFYTDGVTEAKNHNGDEFGNDRLQQVINNAAAEPAGRLGQAIIEAVEQHASASARFDDLTVCVVKIR